VIIIHVDVALLALEQRQDVELAPHAPPPSYISWIDVRSIVRRRDGNRIKTAFSSSFPPCRAVVVVLLGVAVGGCLVRLDHANRVVQLLRGLQTARRSRRRWPNPSSGRDRAGRPAASAGSSAGPQ